MFRRPPQKITQKFLNIQISPKRRPYILESDRGKEWPNPIFQNFLKGEIIQQYSRVTHKGPSIAD